MPHQASRTALVTWAVASILAGGCAPTFFPPNANYTTVATDPKHDTEKAQKQYRDAMKSLDKYLSGDRSEAKLAKAESQLQAAMVSDVRFGPAHNSLGTVYFYQNKLYLAAWEFQYAMKLMPDRFEPLNNLGLVFETAGKYDQAAEFYRQAREKDSKQPDVIANLARAEIRSGHSVDQERCVLEDVVATNPRYEWRDWASDLMGVHPLNGIPIDAHVLPEPMTLPAPTEEKQPSSGVHPEELPLPSNSTPTQPSDVKPENAAPILKPAVQLLPTVSSELLSKEPAKP